MSINNVVIVGRLTRDPELKYTQSSEALSNLRVAVDRAGAKQQDGQMGAGFFDVTVWGNTAENVCRYLSKGSQLAVQGALRFREWEAQDGSKRTAVEIRAFQVQFLGGASDSNDDDGQTRMRPANLPDQDAAPAPTDDDIPF